MRKAPTSKRPGTRREAYSVKIGPVCLEVEPYLTSSPLGIVVVAEVGPPDGGEAGRSWAASLPESGYSALWVDLVLPAEAGSQLVCFDIPLLAERLKSVVQTVTRSGSGQDVPLAIVGSGNAAPAAIWACHGRSTGVKAIIAAFSRPHLAEPFVSKLRVPTLLLVDEQEKRQVAECTRVEARLRCAKRLVAVDTHSKVAMQHTVMWREMTNWLNRYLGRSTADVKGIGLLRRNFALLVEGLKRKLI